MLEEGTGCELPDELTHCNQTWLSLTAQGQDSSGGGEMLLTQRRGALGQAGEGVAGGGTCPLQKTGCPRDAQSSASKLQHSSLGEGKPLGSLHSCP